MMMANRRGTRMVETRKARPRICSRYSRRATRIRLCIGFASHRLDEDLFERRLDQFETIDCGDSGRFVKQLLGVALRLQADLGVAGEVFCFGVFRALEE